jgi:hypothetical protein
LHVRQGDHARVTKWKSAFPLQGQEEKCGLAPAQCCTTCRSCPRSSNHATARLICTWSFLGSAMMSHGSARL